MGDKDKKLNEPLSVFDMIRCGGIASMYRLPIHKDASELDACFVGVPFDNGTTNRNGARFGPRQIRNESVMLRSFNNDTGGAPYECLNVGDIGDINMQMFDVVKSCEDIRAAFREIIKNGCRPLTMGGDHTISYPILQAFKEKYGPVALVHLDAHADTNDSYCGFKVTHGTPFRRAVEEDLLDCKRVVQIGLRASGYGADDWAWGIKQGFTVFPARDCWHRSMVPMMDEVRRIVGTAPVYLSFDIDVLDPSFAPGTGTPEIAGLSTIQAVEIIRGLKGLNVVGCDLVEVSPPYDNNGITSITAANLLFEMLCVLPGVKNKQVACPESRETSPEN